MVLTCEHASMALPFGWTWPDDDRWVVGTHWSYDPGVASVVRALASHNGWGAVLAGFSRLVVDPNRDLDSATLFRLEAEGRPLALNAELDDRRRAERIETLYRPYHQRVHEAVRDEPGATVLSMHSFTPVYEGQPRSMEIGVLFDVDEGPARALASTLEAAGYNIALNEPYSGREGLMYAAQAPATRLGRRALELELRQDLLEDAAWVERLVTVLSEAIPRHA